MGGLQVTSLPLEGRPSPCFFVLPASPGGAGRWGWGELVLVPRFCSLGWECGCLLRASLVWGQRVPELFNPTLGKKALEILNKWEKGILFKYFNIYDAYFRAVYKIGL